MCKNDEGIVMPNFAALRAAVFPLSTKNLRGADIRPPPVGARDISRVPLLGVGCILKSNTPRFDIFISHHILFGPECGDAWCLR